MPVFQISAHLAFPDPELAEDSGLLAIGGDLSPERLLLAYSMGIFPWFGDGDPILWWCPDPRMVLFPENFKVSKSLAQTIRSRRFDIRFDSAFEEVIRSCAEVSRPDEAGTWITRKMRNAYIRLHNLGYAHSVETWKENKLVGGLYGVSIGKAFFGESMFHLERDASKFALFHLVERCKLWDFHFIDAQQETSHLKSLGAETVPRIEFLTILEIALTNDTCKGPWNTL